MARKSGGKVKVQKASIGRLIGLGAKKGVEMLGITFPPMDIFRNAAANILLVCVGYFALVIAAAIAVPLVKIAVTVAAVAVVGYGLYNLYKTFTGQSTKDILPDTYNMPDKK